MRRNIGMLSALMLLISCGTGQAVTLGAQNWTDGGTILTLTANVPTGNQPLNIQCLICGDHQPQQSPTFGYTDFKNNGSDSDLLFFSTNVSGGGNPGADTVGIPYDGSFLRAYLVANGSPNLTFAVGVDVNDNNTAQILESFYLLNLTTHTVLAAFSPGPGGTPILSQNNGTGFPDYTISGFNISLGTDIHIGDQLIFFARISNASDGPDSFFLIPNVDLVTPLPAAVWMFGGGLGLLAMFAGRKRKQKSAWDVTQNV